MKQLCPQNESLSSQEEIDLFFDNENHKKVSFFEFWPAWVMYFPVGVQWLFLALRHRSLTLPFLANPSLTVSGMVGVPKSELMKQATGKCAQAILPWITFNIDNRDATIQANEAIKAGSQKGIVIPFACKPDIGCRGAGVKLVEDVSQLIDIIESYPTGTSIVCQKLASYEPEVGVFYTKNPETGQSEITSLTYKYLPNVIGDGVKTLGELIEQDARAGALLHMYQQRHKDDWSHVLAEGEKRRLVFSASHSKGAVFRDARDLITPQLTQAIEEIMQGLPDFYYGRLDVKFKDFSSLKKGETLEIVEINGASAESAHIWDGNASFLEAMRALLWQYRTLFSIGAYHRKQGKKAPSLATFFKHYRLEKNLTKHYPYTD